MKPRLEYKLIAVTVAAILAAPIAESAATQDQELQRLRNENTLLKKQIEDSRNNCGTLALPQATVPAPAAAASPSAAAPAASVGAAPPTVPAETQTPPSGYKLVKIEPVKPYSDTGCDKGAPSIDKRWKRKDNWSYLRGGMSMLDVEELLGVEHYNVAGSSRVGWEYGKCEAAARGSVVFQDGTVQYWRQPNF